MILKQIKLNLIRMVLGVLILMLSTSINAQHDLMNLLEIDEGSEVNYTSATFKAGRLINGHTIMTRRAGTLEFLIAHRFGRLNAGLYELFGLDDANVRFGLDYSIMDNLTIGFGRNSFEKTYDGFVKWALIRQQTGKRTIPFSATFFSSIAINTLRNEDSEREVVFSDRLSYTYQMLLARKMNVGLSIQLMPSLVHFNLVDEGRKNDLAVLGVGGRVKLTKRLSLNAEYYYRFDERSLRNTYDPISIGIDLETGGHVFQLQFTNSRSMVEKSFLRETTGDFFSGDIHFGFNITRSF